jgi:hypothetical protein
MGTWLRALDSILRGETTRLSRLQDGQIDIPTGGLTVLIVLLGAFHGTCMGWFALFNREVPEYRQLLASAVKVPALFLLTLLVTFPSLYVFNALVGSRLTFLALYRILIASLSITLAVLASFGPIVAFFSLTTSSYAFMVLLNVATFAVAGMLGLTFLLQTMHRLTLPTGPGALPPSAEPAGALDRVEGSILGKNVRAVFVCWIVVFALVGAQMSWVLRPFIGDPNRDFAWFRPRESHFFESLWRTIVNLFAQ